MYGNSSFLRSGWFRFVAGVNSAWCDLSHKGFGTYARFKERGGAGTDGVRHIPSASTAQITLLTIIPGDVPYPHGNNRKLDANNVSRSPKISQLPCTRNQRQTILITSLHSKAITLSCQFVSCWFLSIVDAGHSEREHPENSEWISCASFYICLHYQTQTRSISCISTPCLSDCFI